MKITIQEIEKYSLKNLQLLIENQIAEDKHIEFKRELPGKRDEDKREFLADFSSFANTDGGCLFYGIKEENGIAKELVGIETKYLDEAILAIEQLLQSSLEPRISGYKMIPIKISDDRSALVIFIPSSLQSPHVVNYMKHWRFYARHSGGKYRLDVSELKSQFVSSEKLKEDIRNFKVRRLQKLLSSEFPVLLSPGLKFVLHLVPLHSFYENKSEVFDEAKLPHHYSLNDKYLSSYLNFDGKIYHNQSGNIPGDGYIMVFRNGCLEIVNANFIEDDKRILYRYKFEYTYIQEVPEYMKILERIEVRFPILVFLTIINGKGYNIHPLDAYQRMVQGIHTLDRDFVDVPEILITEDPKKDYDLLLKPLFDPIWNAFGFARSINYKDGRFKLPN